ncbi:hypothetical protein KC19_2G155300 [Ceratodon purpureus]|uniref:V-SNARE coiled-coil homology domain-containing protein n=1 Tax=Ceratodon purpureus TaxID=3225 RepID=A0A8T0IVX2_CERPU|nr:hypothetical protein KC19_2G155300 [Ceratodon purpureus]
MQDKVSIAATKEKVSNVAAKGGKAFMSLIHKAKHSVESPKSPKDLSESKSPEGSSELKSPEASSEPKSLEASSEPKSPRTLSAPKSPRNLSQLKPTGTFNETDGDSDELAASSPKTSMERKGKLVNRLKRGLKVGKKNTDAENRSELLDGNPNDQSPRIRSTDSIKAAYGHKPSTDPTSIAAQNREKLIERQEKLEAMNKDSEEMVEGAGDFASMAEELAKKIENKPWYKL